MYFDVYKQLVEVRQLLIVITIFYLSLFTSLIPKTKPEFQKWEW